VDQGRGIGDRAGEKGAPSSSNPQLPLTTWRKGAGEALRAKYHCKRVGYRGDKLTL